MSITHAAAADSAALSQSAGLTLRLEQAEDVVLTDYRERKMLASILGFLRKLVAIAPSFGEEAVAGIRWSLTGSLDVADNGTGLVVHELDADLGDTTTGAYTQSENLPKIRPSFRLSCNRGFDLRRGGLRFSFFRGRGEAGHTGTAQDAGDLHKLDRLLSGIHFDCGRNSTSVDQDLCQFFSGDATRTCMWLRRCCWVVGCAG